MPLSSNAPETETQTVIDRARHTDRETGREEEREDGERGRVPKRKRDTISTTEEVWTELESALLSHSSALEEVLRSVVYTERRSGEERVVLRDKLVVIDPGFPPEIYQQVLLFLLRERAQVAVQLTCDVQIVILSLSASVSVHRELWLRQLSKLCIRSVGCMCCLDILSLCLCLSPLSVSLSEEDHQWVSVLEAQLRHRKERSEEWRSALFKLQESLQLRVQQK